MPDAAAAPSEDLGPFRLYERWPWIHLVIAVGLAAVAIATWPWVQEHPRWGWFLFLAIPVLVLHEWEEFMVPGGFIPWFNAHVYGSRASFFPLSKQLAAGSQMPLMILYPVLAILGARWPWVGLGGLFGLVADGMFHITGTATGGRYSPGTVTAFVLYLPLGFTATHYFVRTGQVTIAGLLGAVFGAVIIFNVVIFLPPRLLAARFPARLEGDAR